MKKHLKLIVGLCAAVLGLVGLFMIFAQAIVEASGLTNIGFNGSDIAFGKEGAFGASAYILAFILPIVGVVFAILAALGKLGKVAPIIAAVCFVVGGVIFFLPSQVAMPYSDGVSIPASVVTEFHKELAEYYKLGAGAIVGGLFCILAACGSVATMFLGKKAD